MQSAEFDHLVKSLLGETPPRVWSLLVTIFGDLALAPGDRLSGACINALTATIGIKPEATRVALHRLRKEGWIDSHRDGRQSRYGLTDHGRAETLAARKRVYADTGPETCPVLVLDDPSVPLGEDIKRTATSIHIAPHWRVTTDQIDAKSDWSLALSLDHTVPAWVTIKLCQEDVRRASQALAHRLEAIASGTDYKRLDLLQKTALRVSIVHEWRRLILRVPHFPDALFSDQWRGEACREHLKTLLTTLPAPDIPDLESCISKG